MLGSNSPARAPSAAQYRWKVHFCWMNEFQASRLWYLVKNTNPIYIWSPNSKNIWSPNSARMRRIEMLASCWRGRVRGPEGNDFDLVIMSQIPSPEGNSGSWSVQRGGAAPGNTWGWRSSNAKNAPFLRWLAVMLLWNHPQLAARTDRNQHSNWRYSDSAHFQLILVVSRTTDKVHCECETNRSSNLATLWNAGQCLCLSSVFSL